MGCPVALPADTPRFATWSTAPSKSSRSTLESLVDLIRRIELGLVFLEEGHVGQHIVFGLIHQRGELGHHLVGHGTPLSAGGLGVVLGEGVAMKAETMRRSLLPAMGKGIALEMDTAPLPVGAVNFGDGGFDALVRIADDQFHSSQAPRVRAPDLA